MLNSLVQETTQVSEVLDNILAQAESINKELKRLGSDNKRKEFLNDFHSLNTAFGTLLEATIQNKIISEVSEYINELKNISEKNAIFYLLLLLYTQGLFEDNPEVEEIVYNILTKFLSYTDISKKEYIDDIHRKYISQVGPRKLLPYHSNNVCGKVADTLGSHSTIIAEYTRTIISMVSEEIEDTSDYIKSFSDFLFSESILDWRKYPNIQEAPTSLKMVHGILLELLLGNFYENDKELMIQVAGVLVRYYEGALNEGYILNYISQYTS